MIDVLTYQDRVVLLLDVPHPCPACGVMAYMFVQRMGVDSLTAKCMGCDKEEAV